MNGLEPRHHEQIPHDVRGVARINLLSKEFELKYNSLDIGQEISSRIEHIIVSRKRGSFLSQPL